MLQTRPNSRILDAAETKAKNDSHKAAFLLAKAVAKEAVAVAKTHGKIVADVTKAQKADMKRVIANHAAALKIAVKAESTAIIASTKATAALTKLTPAAPAATPAATTLQ